MKVSIKEFNVEMEVKKSGIEFGVSGPMKGTDGKVIKDADGKTKQKHRGDLILKNSGLIWCEGRTDRDNGREISWDKFIAFMEE